MHVKILGPGCKNCHTLEERTREALAELGMEASVESVTDYAEIAAAGVMKTPGLVVDDELVLSGKVPKVKEIRALLSAR
ncbi:MAG: thioredoxin family protein [Acidimicrobiales bacterium]